MDSMQLPVETKFQRQHSGEVKFFSGVNTRCYWLLNRLNRPIRLNRCSCCCEIYECPDSRMNGKIVQSRLASVWRAIEHCATDVCAVVKYCMAQKKNIPERAHLALRECVRDRQTPPRQCLSHRRLVQRIPRRSVDRTRTLDIGVDTTGGTAAGVSARQVGPSPSEFCFSAQGLIAPRLAAWVTRAHNAMPCRHTWGCIQRGSLYVRIYNWAEYRVQ